MCTDFGRADGRHCVEVWRSTSTKMQHRSLVEATCMLLLVAKAKQATIILASNNMHIKCGI